MPGPPLEFRADREIRPPWASPVKPTRGGLGADRPLRSGRGRHQAVATDGRAASATSPTNRCQFAQSSRRSWLTRAAEIRNMQATRPVVSPAASFSTSCRSRFDNVESQLTKSSRAIAISAGPCRAVFDQNFTPFATTAIEPIESLDRDSLRRASAR